MLNGVKARIAATKAQAACAVKPPRAAKTPNRRAAAVHRQRHGTPCECTRAISTHDTNSFSYATPAPEAC